MTKITNLILAALLMALPVALNAAAAKSPQNYVRRIR